MKDINWLDNRINLLPGNYRGRLVRVAYGERAVLQVGRCKTLTLTFSCENNITLRKTLSFIYRENSRLLAFAGAMNQSPLTAFSVKHRLGQYIDHEFNLFCSKSSCGKFIEIVSAEPVNKIFYPSMPTSESI